ncbi:DUF1697 domain-containing protein [Blastococcus sp. SYSU D00820]
MPTHVALLRGINVGRTNRISMADLTAVVTGLGHTDVATYLQSGNVVLTAAGSPTTTELADRITAAIAADLGLTVPVVVLTRAEVAAVVAGNPFPEQDDPKRLHVAARGEPYPPEMVDELTAALAAARAAGSAEDARIEGRVLWLHTPEGFLASKLAERLARPRYGATTRNWRTVTALARMVG